MTEIANSALPGVSAEAPGVVATDDERYNASLVNRVDQHESLAYFWVKFDGDPTPFEPGQYMTIGVFADNYLHRDPGYGRFFLMYAVFLFGMVVASLAGTIESMFFGWELVGLSSALLVAYFHQRPSPVASRVSHTVSPVLALRHRSSP